MLKTDGLRFVPVWIDNVTRTTGFIRLQEILVQFEISQPSVESGRFAIVMADAESANPGELAILYDEWQRWRIGKFW